MKLFAFSLISSVVMASAIVQAATHISIPLGTSCAEITATIRALPVDGGTVTLEAGTYLCTEPIIIDRDNVILTGQGMAMTLIKAAPLKPLPVVVIGSVINVLDAKTNVPYPDHLVQNIELHNLSIDGDYQSQPATVKAVDFECYDPLTGQSQNCGTDSGHFIRNNSLTIRHAQHVRVSNIETRGAYSGGITIEKVNKDIQIDNFSSRKNYFDGFAGYETTDSKFTNFNVSQNQYSGISVDWGFEWNTFENGIADGNGDNGIFSADVGHNIYHNLRLTNNHTFGMYFSGTFDSVTGQPIVNSCNENKIDGLVTSGLKAGVMVNSPCEGTEISNTKILQPQGKCLMVYPDTQVAITSSFCSSGSAQSIVPLVAGPLDFN